MVDCVRLEDAAPIGSLDTHERWKNHIVGTQSIAMIKEVEKIGVSLLLAETTSAKFVDICEVAASVP